MKNILLCIFLLLNFLLGDNSQGAQKNAKKTMAEFSWYNPPEQWTLKDLPKSLKHASFESPSMNIEVGYYIYLPDRYNQTINQKRRYPVVYHLHGGRPGSEKKSISLAPMIDHAMKRGDIQDTIYIFPNGGPMSWYNYPQKKNGMGEDIFIQELIPHIDKTYRTIASRQKRALQGFSQGGRGTTRIMFKHARLFSSFAPGDSGYEPEERIRDNDGSESANIRFSKGNDAWTLAKNFAAKKKTYPIKPLIWVGTKGFNYEYNLKYIKYLDSLGIPYEKLIVPDVPHSAKIFFQKSGLKLMQFHNQNFGKLNP